MRKRKKKAQPEEEEEEEEEGKKRKGKERNKADPRGITREGREGEGREEVRVVKRVLRWPPGVASCWPF